MDDYSRFQEMRGNELIFLLKNILILKLKKEYTVITNYQ